MADPVDYAYLPMWIYLLLGAAANIPFLVRAVLDLVSAKRRRRFTALPEAAPALVGLSLSECAWVLPCLVQCFLSFALGSEGQWAPGSEMSSMGCNVMGFYSVFASFSGMISVLWIVFMTYRSVNGSKPFGTTTGILVCTLIITCCLIFSSLPFMGVGSFKYTGEGFCYMDWKSQPLAVLMLLISLAAMSAVMTLLLLTVKRGGWISRTDLTIMGLSFLSAWILWIPATIIGLADGNFPPKYMLMGGILGHLQALINPYIYGMRWYRSVQQLGASDTPSGGEAHSDGVKESLILTKKNEVVMPA